jgi:GT2 family glycosyltransferase
MRRDWVEQICFTIKDRITKAADGSYSVEFLGEDWDFSRQARRLGIPLWATRKVRLMHVGQGYFPNFQEWGTETRDQGTEVFAGPTVGIGICPLLDHQPVNP